ncbi:unnamed protein product [Paramecium sonneborni]|uniref:Ubiquitin-like protease family profile domain-containing protein n=1 Tax=Paramecium sonneborni TaxID=65129 RepID=A0A8S1KZE3_9CILI|nr:unnamed protein product [Paramecium sonneborni]
MKIKEPFTFQQYVDWAFESNKGTYIHKTQKEQLTKSNNSIMQIEDDQLNDIIWLFRKCQNKNELDNQNKAFTEKQHIIRHVFLFLLILVQKKQDKRKIYTLMNSTAIQYVNEDLKVFIADEKQEILKQAYYSKDFVTVGVHFTQNFKQILDIWRQLKNLPENYQLMHPNSDTDFLCDFPRINTQFNFIQIFKLKEIKKQKENEKKILEQKLQQERLFQSNLRKEQIQFIKLVKIVSIRKPNYFNQQLFLQPNGNLIQGKIWFPINQPDLCPLWLDYNFQIQSFNNFNNLNQELKYYTGFISYQGPVNDYFEPQTYDYDKDTEGVMKTINIQETIYKGGFKNGLFDGKNRVYTFGCLIFYGFFKNGQKHGEGYELDSQQTLTYFRGMYESNFKQGLFVDYKLINYSKREKEFSKIGNWVEYYKNGIKQKEISQQADQVYNVNQNPGRKLLNFNEFEVNNFQLASLLPGGWIKSKIVDILLKQLTSLVNYSNLINQNIHSTQTLFFNCNQCQDIFGSMITYDNDINDKIFQNAFKKHLESNYQQKNQKYDDHMSGQNKIKNIRIVFYLNLDRSHFLSVVYENEKLYLIDSLEDTREPLKIQIQKLLIKYQFEVKDKDNINISQQKNTYDDGIYTIYYISQFIKNQNLTIEQMIGQKFFEISQSKINYLRYQIYQNLKGDGASIMQL